MVDNNISICIQPRYVLITCFGLDLARDSLQFLRFLMDMKLVDLTITSHIIHVLYLFFGLSAAVKANG